MAFPPLCIDCDKEIPFDRYQLGVCPECMEERAHMEGCECPECRPDLNDPRAIEEQERREWDEMTRSEP